MPASRVITLAFCILALTRILPGGPLPVHGETLKIEEPPQYGVYYEKYEPTFYTGFAPRAEDPKRIHLHIGRGNQLRATVVLSNSVLESYAEDLQTRLRTYRNLIAEGRIVPTQNSGYEAFVQALEEMEIDLLVTEQAPLSPARLRQRNLALLERLNPGRIFRIQMSADEVARRWVAELRPDDRKSTDSSRLLELLNLMLPTRMFIPKLDADSAKELRGLVDLAPAAGETDMPEAMEPFKHAFFRVLGRVTHGMYPMQDGWLRFDEFTAIYPVGSVNEYTKYKGRQIPLYPTPGLWTLTTHQRSKTVEHIPTKVIYGYFPWIPYMHVGPKLHNSFHTLWWQMRPASTSFLPPEWNSAEGASREGKAYPYLWLLSRGPMSHGCTHINAGHISELRQIMPSETKLLYEVQVFINQSYLYDLFDIDGDFEPEVMGVRYFIAFSLQNKKAHQLRARNERHAFYEWLYGGELQFDPTDRGFFTEANDCRFVGRRAAEGREYDRIPLYEAAYEPEKIQFYKLVDIPFARKLRRVGVDYRFPEDR